MNAGGDSGQAGQQELIVTQWDVNKKRTFEKMQIINELIVTQWDVNYVMGALLGDGGLELIVTQWDVNDSGVGDHVTGCTELIVTQWDVNKVSQEDNNCLLYTSPSPRDAQ